jgi:hypothetical protein
MKLRTSIIAAGAAVVLGTTGAFVLPAVASAHSATTTLKFIAVQKAMVSFDMLYFKVISSSSAAVNATIDTKGGFLYGTFNVNLKTGAVTNGKVTGGTGAFAGATGTITAKTISSTKHAVTITYSG